MNRKRVSLLWMTESLPSNGIRILTQIVLLLPRPFAEWWPCTARCVCAPQSRVALKTSPPSYRCVHQVFLAFAPSARYGPNPSLVRPRSSARLVLLPSSSPPVITRAFSSHDYSVFLRSTMYEMQLIDWHSSWTLSNSVLLYYERSYSRYFPNSP